MSSPEQLVSYQGNYYSDNRHFELRNTCRTWCLAIIYETSEHQFTIFKTKKFTTFKTKIFTTFKTKKFATFKIKKFTTFKTKKFTTRFLVIIRFWVIIKFWVIITFWVIIIFHTVQGTFSAMQVPQYLMSIDIVSRPPLRLPAPSASVSPGM